MRKVNSLSKRTTLVILFWAFCINLIGSTSIKVGNYNIRLDTSADTGIYAWRNRYPYVVQTLVDNDYDVCGLEELTANQSSSQIDDLMALCGNTYDIYYWGVESASSVKGAMNGIIYKKNKFELLDKGFYFLSADPNLPLKSWDSSQQRNTVWVHLRDKNTQQHFYFFATHVDVNGKNAKREGTRLNAEKMIEIAGHHPAFLVGDFNSNAQYNCVHNWLAAFYDDACAIAEQPYTGSAYTLVPEWMGKTKSKSRLDWIYTNCSVINYNVITETYGRPIPPSDHYAIICEANLLDHSNEQHLWTATNDEEFKETLTKIHKNDTILLAEGTYTPFTCDQSVVIKGGFDAAFENQVGYSTFTGDTNGDDVYDEHLYLTNNYSDNAKAIIKMTNAGSLLSLSRCVIIGGVATGPSGNGGGIMTRGSLRLDDCTIRSCRASQSGAGIYAEGLTQLHQCTIIGNTASSMGGGAALIGTNWRHDWSNNTLCFNTAMTGSALYLTQVQDAFFTANCFYANESKRFGTLCLQAADYEQMTHMVMVNNAFFNNVLSSKSNTLFDKTNGGSAIYFNALNTSHLVMVANTIVGNYTICHTNDGDVPSDFKGAAVQVMSGKSTCLCNIIAGNYSSASTADIHLGDNASKIQTGYNLYSAPGTIPYALDATDICSITSKAASRILLTIYEGTSDSVFHPVVYNEMTRPELKVLGTTFDGSSLIVPDSYLYEPTLNLELTGDYLLNAKITTDMMGHVRTNGESIRGAFEYGYEPIISSLSPLLGHSPSVVKIVKNGQVYIQTPVRNYSILGQTW